MKSLMRSLNPENILSSNRVAAAVIAFAVTLFLVTNLPWELDDYDQAQQAFSSFEMVKEGHWFYQRTPHLPIAQKPPFVGWLSAASFTLTRSWNVAWRLPSFLAAAAIAILLFRAGSDAYGRAAGLLAASAFSLNMLTARLATMVRTDMPLALALFLPGLMIFQKIRRRETWSRKERWLFLLLLTVSLWTKGPFAYWFLLPAVAVFQWRYRKSPVTGAWCGWWPWLGALLLFLLWVVGGIVFVPGFIHEIVAFEFLSRLDPSAHRAQPIYFYFVHLLHQFAPWSIAIILLAIILAKQSKESWRRLAAGISPELFWLIAWSLGGFLIMSLVPSKRVDRVYPAIPPLCLLLGAQVARGFGNPHLRLRIYRWAAIALMSSLLICAGYAVFKITAAHRGQADALERFSSAVMNEASREHWRYEIVRGRASGRDGMLLYLQKMHFIDSAHAIELWRRRELDALVVPREKMPELTGQLQDVRVTALQSPQRKNFDEAGYAFITRQK